MMMFAATAAAAAMWWIVIGRMIVGVVAAWIARMTATVIARMTAIGMIVACRRPDSAGGFCDWWRRVPALGIEACSADRIHCRRTRMPVIGGRELVAVHAGGMVMVELVCRRLDMILLHGCLFLRGRLSLDTRAAVEARMIVHHCIVDHCPIDIGVVNDGGIDVHYRGVVMEETAAPLSAIKSGSPVTIAIIDAAIKSDMRSPITAMPAIDAAGKAPVTGSP